MFGKTRRKIEDEAVADLGEDDGGDRLFLQGKFFEFFQQK